MGAHARQQADIVRLLATNFVFGAQVQPASEQVGRIRQQTVRLADVGNVAANLLGRSPQAVLGDGARCYHPEFIHVLGHDAQLGPLIEASVKTFDNDRMLRVSNIRDSDNDIRVEENPHDPSPYSASRRSDSGGGGGASNTPMARANRSFRFSTIPRSGSAPDPSRPLVGTCSSVWPAWT